MFKFGKKKQNQSAMPAPSFAPNTHTPFTQKQGFGTAQQIPIMPTPPANNPFVNNPFIQGQAMPNAMHGHAVPPMANMQGSMPPMQNAANTAPPFMPQAAIPNSPFAMPATPAPPVQHPPMQEPQPMPMPRYYKKPTSPWVRLLSVMLMISALGFLSYYVYRMIVPAGDQYATVQKASYGQSYDGQVLIIRDEVVFDDEGITDIEYISKEGSQIGLTELVAHVYTSGYSDRERRALQNFRDQIKRYQIELLTTESTFDQKMNRLVGDVNARALEVRNIVQGEKGNMVNLEKDLAASLQARQDYFREKYAEDQRLSRLYDDETTQLKRIESWKKQNNSNVAGTLSFYTDGYEYGLQIGEIENYSPSYVQRLINGQKPEESAGRRGKSDIYRIVRSNEWYALMIIQNSTWNPVQNSVLDLTLQQFSDISVQATIVSFARTGNQLLLRLRVNSDINPILYTRNSKARIGQYASALAVPNRAIHEQDGTTGVVVVADTKKLFVPCEIIQKQDGLTFIKPQHNNTLFEGQSILLF